MEVSLSLQEEWSPELLSELQRAVPVLESGSLEENLASVSPDWPRNFKDDRGLRWSSWAHEARGLEEGPLVKPDLLSETAMALPMSTMTSGKRKTYKNRSTFQAHVCCVMDPEQVPKILDSLQKSPHLASASSWPHACRILSPFDGQVHVCSEDDEDPGAGEKILGLLERMGLENLLLVISHWTSGVRNRLGAELFKCVTEQCKELLKELQEALRASFPPEELLLRSDGEPQTLEDGQTPDGSGTESLFGSDVQYFENDTEEALSRHIDLRAIGATPPAELMYASRGVCIQPHHNRRTWPTRGKQSGGHSAREKKTSPPVVGRSCFAATSDGNATFPTQHHGSFAQTQRSSKGSMPEAAGHGHTFMTEGEATDIVDFNELSNEELEKLCQQLEHDRDCLETQLASHQEVIESFKVPSFSKGSPGGRKLRSFRSSTAVISSAASSVYRSSFGTSDGWNRR